MQSRKWFAFRDAWATRQPSEPVCAAGCGTTWTQGLDLHHLTYERLGQELDSDLIALCRAHHKTVHQLLDRSPQWRKLGIRAATLLILERITNGD